MPPPEAPPEIREQSQIHHHRPAFDAEPADREGRSGRHQQGEGADRGGDEQGIARLCPEMAEY
jgi:hypothetical protein